MKLLAAVDRAIQNMQNTIKKCSAKKHDGNQRKFKEDKVPE